MSAGRSRPSRFPFLFHGLFILISYSCTWPTLSPLRSKRTAVFLYSSSRSISYIYYSICTFSLSL
ncbi:hypothetical protein BOTBODRAFT_445731 [Botryobasidium botryosum FD-172 SS1]|uniref:Uncharacterized protein n=1 Tax=Botryobasidium botryosum (strain FD-172 SS1) TaxID=930990 RepID=A0A067N6D0_BOTB1|nr:hypothetical protein BOTBODRAFT_445731 [Botryobasidium botryosum FD-172 SS1]